MNPNKYYRPEANDYAPKSLSHASMVSIFKLMFIGVNRGQGVSDSKTHVGSKNELNDLTGIQT